MSTGTALKIYNSTIANNSCYWYGGGICIEGTGACELYSVIVAGNDGIAHAADDLYGTYDKVEYSLIEVNNGYTLTVGNDNIEGQDPLLSVLADNGGSTMTHALDKTSPAYNVGTNSLALLYDQRNEDIYLRSSSGGVDIGAFEFNLPPPTGIIITIK